MTSGPPSQPALGFLTVLEHAQLGLVGGYLVLNTAGRPLEFHCTAPLKPNRAQQILFGPTLDDYLYGEQIGQTLVAKGSLEPLAVCTDTPRALAVRPFIAPPAALVLGNTESPAESVAAASAASSEWRLATSVRVGQLAEFTLGRNRLAVAATHEADRELILARLDGLASFDLAEPFARMREAVEEAHRTSRAA